MWIGPTKQKNSCPTRLKGSIFVIGLLVGVYFFNVLVFQKATLDAESLWKMQKSMVWNSGPSPASLTSSSTRLAVSRLNDRNYNIFLTR